MISIDWVGKWFNFLYKKGSPNYSCKGYSFPGKIDNKGILEGKKCKPYLLLNKDFKVVNIYLWRFLKQVYGGGTEIRYKWKQDGSVQLDETLLEEGREQAR